jgi:conjugative transfer region protein TrbK
MTEESTRAVRSRFAGLGWRSVAIAVAAATTGIFAMVALSDPAPPAAHYAIGEAPDAPAPASADPLLAELARCRTLPANGDDARCQAAWEVNRRRFMGESRSYVPPVEPPPIEAAPVDSPTPAASAVAPSSTTER